MYSLGPTLGPADRTWSWLVDPSAALMGPRKAPVLGVGGWGGGGEDGRSALTGCNAKTLKGAEGSCGGRNVRNEVVPCKYLVDQEADWVIAQSKLIPSSGRPVPAFPRHLLSVGALRTEIRIKPVKENRELQINFAFPDLTELYLCKPSSYVSHLLDHE
ncbi:hypothetical protein DFJ73DRAFT_757839 [Zopfochytrium polystomum]|nr:hypothetical protein DFJ73DRAFT_757839 [Zopfochytrium polystomum]